VATTSGAAPAQTAAAKITRTGVDGVKLKRTYKQLRRRGKIGKIRPGCELGGPNTRSARLRKPLKGVVNFTLKRPRRVMDITVRGGATARGVGIGERIKDIKAAYPKAKVDHSTDQTYRFTLVRVPRSGGGRLQFAVATSTKRITAIGIPRIAVCD
jgi:hypothetical protein